MCVFIFCPSSLFWKKNLRFSTLEVVSGNKFDQVNTLWKISRKTECLVNHSTTQISMCICFVGFRTTHSLDLSIYISYTRNVVISSKLSSIVLYAQSHIDIQVINKLYYLNHNIISRLYYVNIILLINGLMFIIY